MQAVQVGDVAGHVKGLDLTLAVAGHGEGCGVAVEEHEAAGGAVALADDVLVWPERLHLHGQGVERTPLVL